MAEIIFHLADINLEHDAIYQNTMNTYSMHTYHKVTRNTLTSKPFRTKQIPNSQSQILRNAGESPTEPEHPQVLSTTKNTTNLATLQYRQITTDITQQFWILFPLFAVKHTT
jgi:hypothetical protein